LASPWVHSALATTRRSRLQLSSVLQVKSPALRGGRLLKRRPTGQARGLKAHGLPVRPLSSAASASSVSICPTSRRFRARPNRKSTPLFWHHAIRSSRAKPLSARSRMRTAGQRRRICPTNRATSVILPWAFSPRA